MAKTVDELNADIRELTKQLGRARRELRDYEASVDRAGRATERAGDSFDQNKTRLEGFSASLRSVGGDIGPLEDMADAFEKLGPAGFAAAAGVAAVVGGVFAVAEFARVTVEATRAAGDLLEEWGQPEAFAGQTDAIRDANQALDDLAFAGQRLQILFAGEMSPTVVATTDVLIALTLAAQDAGGVINAWSGSVADAFELAASALPPLAIGMQAVRADIELVAGAVGMLTDRYRDDAEAIRAQGRALNAATDDLDDYVYALDEAFEAEANFVEITDRERERLFAEDQRRRERQAREEERARQLRAKADAKAREDEAKAAEAAVQAAIDAAHAKVEAEIEAREAAAAEAQRLFDEQTAQIERAADEQARVIASALEVERRGREDLATASVGLADNVLATIESNADTETAAGRRTVREVFAARKALALADIAIATIVSVQQALASAPPPFNAIPAAAMGVAGAANLAAVAAQSPPSFAVGGLVPPDHRLISAQPGEGVLSTAAVRALGEEAVGAMNRGTSSGGGIEVAMVYRHRIFDRFVADNLRRADSPLAGAIQNSRRRRKRRR